MSNFNHMKFLINYMDVQHSNDVKTILSADPNFSVPYRIKDNDDFARTWILYFKYFSIKEQILLQTFVIKMRTGLIVAIQILNILYQRKTL